MSELKISALLSLSLFFALTSPGISSEKKPLTEAVSNTPSSYKTSFCKMMAAAPTLTALPIENDVTTSEIASYIKPPSAHYRDAPLPDLTDSDCIVGVYGNILYPQDEEFKTLGNLSQQIEGYLLNQNDLLPLADINQISLYALNRLPATMIRSYLANQVQQFLENGQSLKDALENAKRNAFTQAERYKEISHIFSAWQGRYEILSLKLIQCADDVKSIVDRDVKAIQKNPDVLQQMIEKNREGVSFPFAWDMREQVMQQMINKVVSVAPNSSYFLALQEVTPLALSDLKKTFKDRNLQWISFSDHFFNVVYFKCL